MKKFSFSLEKVLAYKETVLEKEKGELAKLNLQLREFEQKKQELEEALQEKADSFQLRMKQGINVEELQYYQFVKSSAENQIKQLKDQISLKNQQIERQRTVVIEADKDVRKLSKLKEKQVEEYQYLDAKEQKDMVLETLSNKIGREHS